MDYLKDFVQTLQEARLKDIPASTWDKISEAYIQSLKVPFGIVEDTHNTKDHARLRPSSIGLPALELVCRRFFSVPGDPHSRDKRLSTVFHQGFAFECLARFLLEAMGLPLANVGRKITWRGLGGTLDATVGDYVVDFKTMSDKKFQRIQKLGYMDIPEYVAQNAIYTEALLLPPENSYWLCYNKNTSEIMTIQQRPEAAEKALERAGYILGVWDKITCLADAFEYFDIPEVDEQGNVPGCMMFSDYVDILYHVHYRYKYKIVTKAPHYRYPE